MSWISEFVIYCSMLVMTKGSNETICRYKSANIYIFEQISARIPIPIISNCFFYNLNI